MLAFRDSIFQRIECLTSNQAVVGSNPTRVIMRNKEGKKQNSCPHNKLLRHQFDLNHGLLFLSTITGLPSPFFCSRLLAATTGSCLNHGSRGKFY